MIPAKPFPGHPENIENQPNAATVEFTSDEVSEALFLYVQRKLGVDGPARAVLQFKVNTSVTVRLTYWPIPPVTP